MCVAVLHVASPLRQDLEAAVLRGQLVLLNPICCLATLMFVLTYVRGWACWSDEDYVGRISRLSRRVNAKGLVVLRVMSKTLMSYKRYFTKLWGTAGRSG